jgi:citrate lyase subunit beta / citryl-CoA lyase
VTPVTWLYVPGDRPERFATAAASGADVMIIDLEDAVDAAHKDQARANTVDYLSTVPTRSARPAVHVRVNDLTTRRGRDDLAALADVPGLDALRLPKVDSPVDLDGVPGPVPVYALLESARGLANTEAIAAHPRVAGIALGEQDLAAELSLTDERALDHLRLRVVLAAAAAGVGPVPMSVFTTVTDLEGLRASCAHGRALGMFGRTAIHPRQIPVIRAAFSPTAAEIAEARAVVEAAEAAGETGAFVLPDGRFVDAPIITRARRILALAD